MRFLIAADKFKDSLSGQEVAQAIEAGIRQSIPTAQFNRCAVSDGGEGFLDAVQSATGNAVDRVACEAVDPLGRPLPAEFLYNRETKTAYVELATASGIELLTSAQRNPSQTSTFGTGLVIDAALGLGARRVFVGIGGSASNDGGIGIATALGFRFFDANGIELPPQGSALNRIASIRRPVADFSDIEFFVVNDVDNPLLGASGAAHTYGPQKGADDSMVQQLDQGLRNLADVVNADLNIDAASLPGAGAAGGTGYGLHVFLNAKFSSGARFVLELAKVPDQLKTGTFDWLITGEGQIDDQTGNGKLVGQAGRLALQQGIPAIAFCGVNKLSAITPTDLGLKQVVAIHDPQLRSAQESIAQAGSLLQQAATQWAAEFRLCP